MVPAGFAVEVLGKLSPRVAEVLQSATPGLRSPLEEIRLREGRPLHLVLTQGDCFVGSDGRAVPDPRGAWCAGRDDLQRTFQLMTGGSVYAWEDEVRSGFLTLSGGHRVGVTGHAVTEAGRIRTLKHVAGLNIRIAREVIGCAGPVLPHIVAGGRVLSTLIISPPQAGKTTVLRDLVRQISYGTPGLRGCKVGLVDERSEVAGCWEGVPQRDMGPRTDVLDACPKAEGLMLLVRSLSPQVVAVDEIGRAADAEAVLEALHAGVAVVATAHGSSLEDVSRRPALTELVRSGAFDRAVLLGRSHGPGTVEAVVDLTVKGGGRLAG